MSEIHYLNNAQISERIEGYKFTMPVYGPSTTDPTYFEPTATRIANMRKSATGLKGIFDFEGKLEGTPEEIAKKSLKQLEGATVDVRFSKHGMTKEEISQTVNEKTAIAEEIVKTKKDSAKTKDERLKEEVAIATAVNESLSSQLDKTSSEDTSEE